MSRTVHANVFDTASVDAAVREIRDYALWLRRKANELRKRVADLIANQAQAGFTGAIADNVFAVNDGSPVDYTEFANVNVQVQNNGNISVILATGEDAVFVEFGAGVYYNGAVGSSPNPLGGDLGYTIGSYGKGNGAKRVWGFKGDDGEIHLTHGVPAQMPMYKAEMGVIMDIVGIAREVFSS